MSPASLPSVRVNRELAMLDRIRGDVPNSALGMPMARPVEDGVPQLIVQKSEKIETHLDTSETTWQKPSMLQSTMTLCQRRLGGTSR
jgi:hypothetical protein